MYACTVDVGVGVAFVVGVFMVLSQVVFGLLLFVSGQFLVLDHVTHFEGEELFDIFAEVQHLWL